MTAPYHRLHVIVNPASGPNRPILNTLNDVFRKYDVDWDVSITKRYGDATLQAKEAIARGVDLVVGYGGDGTQHELANAAIGTSTPMGILPGGTGNGFAREIGIPKDLAEAVELLCTSANMRYIDAALVGNEYFIQRLYAGVPPESQTSRDLKERYGLLAYAVRVPAYHRRPRGHRQRDQVLHRELRQDGHRTDCGRRLQSHRRSSGCVRRQSEADQRNGCRSPLPAPADCRCWPLLLARMRDHDRRAAGTGDLDGW
jgi:hypothetical protein